MPNFRLTTRVVLHEDDKRKKEHSPNAKEYETLHVEMHARDYRRFYVNDDNQKRKLPPGEYRLEVDAKDEDDARSIGMKRAKDASTIATSASRFSVLVTCGKYVRGYQLEEITEDPDSD